MAFKTLLIKYSNQIYHYNILNKTILRIAVEKENVEIIKLLLQYDNLDMNEFIYVFYYYFFMIFIKSIISITFLNKISTSFQNYNFNNI